MQDDPTAPRVSNPLQFNGGSGMGGFGHPTETQDIYRELGQGHTAGNAPALPTPLNPPLTYPFPQTTGVPPPKRQYEVVQFQLANGTAERVIAFTSPPEYIWITTYGAAGALLAATNNAGIASGAIIYTLGPTGELIIPCLNGYTTIQSIGSVTINAIVRAVSGYSLALSYRFQ